MEQSKNERERESMVDGSGGGRGAGPEGGRCGDGEGEGGKANRKGPAGSVVRASGKDGPQIVRSDGRRWTDEAEEIFLDHLAATCNYTLSARRTGFSREAIYKRRRRDPGFARNCQDAIAQGVARIDALLVRAAEDMLEGRAPEGTATCDCPHAPIAPMTVQDAIAILKLHRPSVTGEGKRPGWRGRPRSLDEVKASILRKLSAIERARAAERDDGGDSGPA